MTMQQYLGRLCPFAKSCPVYQEKLIIEHMSSYLIKNVFCNRGHKGWKNCMRFKLAAEGADIPPAATPYEA